MIQLLRLSGLLGGGWRGLAFEPFREGIAVHHLYRSASADGPAMALLRYEPGASVPLHEHVGVEQVLILDGRQDDERGSLHAGDLAINPPDARLGQAAFVYEFSQPPAPPAMAPPKS